MDMPVEAGSPECLAVTCHIPHPLATIRPATMVTPPVPSRRQVVNPVRPGREQRQQRTRVPGCGWSGRLQLPPERCPSGLRSTPGKCVWVNSSSRVRLEPPPGGERTRRRRRRRAAPKGVSRRRRRIIPPSPPLPHHGRSRVLPSRRCQQSSDHRLLHSPHAGYDALRNEGDPAGPLATTSWEPRQSRKGRAVAEGSILGGTAGRIASRCQRRGVRAA